MARCRDDTSSGTVSRRVRIAVPPIAAISGKSIWPSGALRRDVIGSRTVMRHNPINGSRWFRSRVARAAKPEHDETILWALAKVHRWRRRIESGKAKPIADLAAHGNVANAYVCRLLPFTCLAPDIEAAILDGRQP